MNIESRQGGKSPTSNFNGLVKSPKPCHACEGRHPEVKDDLRLFAKPSRLIKSFKRLSIHNEYRQQPHTFSDLKHFIACYYSGG